MNFSIRPGTHDDIADLVQLSLLAWVPVFQSFKQVLGPNIYSHIYPDWQKQQSEVVAKICQDSEKISLLVAEVDGAVTGFLAYSLDRKELTGEVELLAVHPDYQNQGIGTALNESVLEAMKANGMRLAVVATGGDPGHAPARKSYEKAGYTGLPLVRYYKDL
jgi:ribosomal protein S18 acetylase RimI-like enzyme